MYRRLLCLVAGLIAVAMPASVYPQSSFDSGRAAFSVTLNDELYPYREFATFVMLRDTSC